MRWLLITVLIALIGYSSVVMAPSVFHEQLANSAGETVLQVEGEDLCFAGTCITDWPDHQLYAGDVTEISEGETKTVRAVFDERGLRPVTINVALELQTATAEVRVRNEDDTGNCATGTASTTSSDYTLVWVEGMDVTGCADGTHKIELDVEDNGGTASNRIFEVYYVTGQNQ